MSDLRKLVRRTSENNKESFWECISWKYKLAESFIRRFQDKVYWVNISWCQNLSESFIREFQDKVDWNWISYSQILSESFIREFQERINYFWLEDNKNVIITEKIKQAFENE